MNPFRCPTRHDTFAAVGLRNTAFFFLSSPLVTCQRRSSARTHIRPCLRCLPFLALSVELRTGWRQTKSPHDVPLLFFFLFTFLFSSSRLLPALPRCFGPLFCTKTPHPPFVKPSGGLTSFGYGCGCGCGGGGGLAAERDVRWAENLARSGQAGLHQGDAAQGSLFRSVPCVTFVYIFFMIAFLEKNNVNSSLLVLL